MPYQETDPHRRNLTVTALAFIIYYSAGGYVKENELHFPMVNIAFSEPWVLKYFAWGALLWFMWRYYQTNKFVDFRNALRTEIESLHSHKLITGYIIKRHPEQENLQDRSLNFFIPAKGFGLEWRMSYKYLLNGSSARGKVRFKGFSGLRIKLNCYLFCLLNHPAIITYWAPYILAFIAILLAT
ncbi:MAG: hypothetical protein JXA04_10650 [Gammaproteobacteria bacterium]|nr:hypothetical protein [Gammaproteobacteria bacterium]